MFSKRITRRKLLGSAGAAGAFIAVGCGDDDEQPTATPTVSGTQPAGSPTATATGTSTPAGAAPRDGSWYGMHSVMTGITLDLHRELYRATAYQTGLAYNNLIVWDDVDRGTVKPDLAASLPEQVDDQTFIFTVRDDVKWQNKAPANGRPLTMDDLRWNIERQITQRLKSGEQVTNFYRHSQIYNRIANVEYVDATHIRFTLHRPDATWIANMCDEFNGIGYPDVFEAIEEDFGTFDPKYVLGTGPYIFDAYNPTRGAHAVRNPDYFHKKDGKEVQFFDEMAWVNLGTDINAQRVAFEQKQIDLLQAPTKEIADAVIGSQPAVKRLEVPNPEGSILLAYDWIKNPIFSNPQLRKAVYLAIDRNLAGAQHFGGLARPNPGIPWAFTDWALSQQELQSMAGYRLNKEEDIREARALWSAGGGDAIDGSHFELVGLSPLFQEWFPAMLNTNLGINKFSVRIIPPATGLQYLQGSPPIGYIGGWGQWVSPDPRIRFGQVRLANNLNNFWKYENPDLEALMGRAFQEFDRARAIELMKDAQRLIHEDAGGSHMEICGPIATWLHWPYLHRVGPTFIRYEKQLGDRSWIDTTDPTATGRRKPSI